MLHRLSSWAMLLSFAITALVVTSTTQQVSAEEDGPVYELRTYTCHPGKLPNLNARFKNHTMKIFEKHGIKNIMYWTPVDKEDTLIYVISHKSRAAADKSWNAFKDDPDWKKAYKESIADGKIVMKVERQYMTATEYSP